MTPLVKEHARVYAGAYLVAGLFVFITLLQSFVAQFAIFRDYTPEQLSAVTGLQWIFASANMFIAASINVLAYLNQSLARANAKREDRPPTNPPYPTK